MIISCNCYFFFQLFAASLPIAPLIALITVLIDIRLDAKRMLWWYRRPLATIAQDIGNICATIRCPRRKFLMLRFCRTFVGAFIICMAWVLAIFLVQFADLPQQRYCKTCDNKNFAIT